MGISRIERVERSMIGLGACCADAVVIRTSISSNRSWIRTARSRMLTSNADVATSSAATRFDRRDISTNAKPAKIRTTEEAAVTRRGFFIGEDFVTMARRVRSYGICQTSKASHYRSRRDLCGNQIVESCIRKQIRSTRRDAVVVFSGASLGEFFQLGGLPHFHFESVCLMGKAAPRERSEIRGFDVEDLRPRSSREVRWP